MNFSFLGFCCLNFGHWDMGQLRECSRHFQGVFRLTVREVCMKIDLKWILKISCKGNCKYFLISSLKLILYIYIYIHTGKMHYFFFWWSCKCSVHSLWWNINLTPNLCKLAGIQYLNLHFSVLSDLCYLQKTNRINQGESSVYMAVIGKKKLELK